MLLPLVQANYIVQYRSDANVKADIQIGDFKASIVPKSNSSKRFKDLSIKRMREDVLVKMIGGVRLEKQLQPTWGIDRIDENGLDGQYDYPSIAGEGTVAYILDTGINTNHTEFGNRASFGFDATFDDTNEGMVDLNGHGTHVAATVAGNTFGVAKKAEVVAVKVCEQGGYCATSWLLKGLEYAVNNATARGVKATINMSLRSQFDSILNDAVKAAVKAGLVVVVIAGNEDEDACNYSPASASDVITVGASTIDDEMATFSNYGKCVDVNAPGVNITSAWKTSNEAFAISSGTSMSAPHVTGISNLYMSMGVLPKDVKATLLRNAVGIMKESVDKPETVNLLARNTNK